MSIIDYLKPSMPEYLQEQIKRIQQKIIQVRKLDSNREIFGAYKHNYHLNPPVSSKRIRCFEEHYQIKLPEEYCVFMQQITNIFARVKEYIAGPDYGLYAFGTRLDEFVEDAENYLKKPCKLSPEMTDEQWEKLVESYITAYNSEFNHYNYNEIFSGILPIGTMGCTYYYGLVLTGKYAGRVVGIDTDLQIPLFMEEENFLEWYEHYLDEVIEKKKISE